MGNKYWMFDPRMANLVNLFAHFTRDFIDCMCWAGKNGSVRIDIHYEFVNDEAAAAATTTIIIIYVQNARTRQVQRNPMFWWFLTFKVILRNENSTQTTNSFSKDICVHPKSNIVIYKLECYRLNNTVRRIELTTRFI